MVSFTLSVILGVGAFGYAANYGLYRYFFNVPKKIPKLKVNIFNKYMV